MATTNMRLLVFINKGVFLERLRVKTGQPVLAFERALLLSLSELGACER
jgi:hypothetical protein